MTTSDERIVRYTGDELEELTRRGESQTDWTRIDAMTPEEIEANVDYEDEGLFDTSRVYAGPGVLEGMDDLANWHEAIYLEAEIVDWFREQHPDDFRNRLNAILRNAMESEKREAS